MGASGSGKSTLLHLLAALDTPDAGEIRIGGERIDTLGDADLTRFRRTRVGLIFQRFNLLPTLTARENVELPGILAGLSPADAANRSAALLDRLGLAGRADHRPDALSGGEQQRVAIARALFFAPPVVLADEPTGALDSATAEELWSLLDELAAERETTVLMVTHEPAAAVHCRRVHVLGDGVILGAFDTEGLDATGVAARAQQFGR
ncbi:MAG: ABC transporter ATP-binding protein [Planctomycetota bacterium]|nr:MAG: ABC transporter ATP-binding protein [Planctomycetota bacterium]